MFRRAFGIGIDTNSFVTCPQPIGLPFGLRSLHSSLNSPGEYISANCLHLATVALFSPDSSANWMMMPRP